MLAREAVAILVTLCHVTWRIGDYSDHSQFKLSHLQIRWLHLQSALEEVCSPLKILVGLRGALLRRRLWQLRTGVRQYC